MQRIPVAYLEIRGANLLIAFFDARALQERTEIYAALRAAAARDKLSGEIAAVWQDARGRTRFLAPPQQHPFFQVASYSQLRAQVNGAIQF